MKVRIEVVNQYLGYAIARVEADNSLIMLFESQLEDFEGLSKGQSLSLGSEELKEANTASVGGVPVHIPTLKTILEGKAS